VSFTRPAGPTRERRDAALHRQQVLAAAERLFGERGFDGVTMDEIAAAAGVGKGTLYRRYGDKGQLVLALMDPDLARLQADLDAIPRMDSALDELKVVMSRILSWTDAHTAQLGVVAAQRAMHCSAMYEWLHNVVLELLVEAASHNETRLGDPVFAADALLAVLDVDHVVFQRQRRGYSAAQIEAGIHMLIDGFRTHATI
jgi:AcrR family transcriptional regulator